MRAVLPILVVVAVAGSTVPASAAPFWQKKNAPPVVAQQVAPAPAQSNSMMAQPHTANQGTAPKAHLNGPGPHNGDWLRKYGMLPPAQQEQKLQNDPMFRSLTPEKQKTLMDRLHFFNSLAPEKKQQVLNRMETYEHLPPEKQQQANLLFQQYKAMPADQRGQVSQAYRKMREMTPDQRTQYFNSDEFRNGLNDQQRDMLKGMSELYPNPTK
jgi:hypothetical protein